LKSLYSAQQKLSLEFNRRRVGKTERVLVEYIDSGLAYCRSYAESPELDGYIIVKDTGDALRAGDFAEVVLRSAEEYDIWGELTK
jgi:ribosomal protein S12 methylthiotransferase